jgi:hypothetical protein
LQHFFDIQFLVFISLASVYLLMLLISFISGQSRSLLAVFSTQGRLGFVSQLLASRSNLWWCVSVILSYIPFLDLFWWYLGWVEWSNCDIWTPFLRVFIDGWVVVSFSHFHFFSLSHLVVFTDSWSFQFSLQWYYLTIVVDFLFCCLLKQFGFHIGF